MRKTLKTSWKGQSSDGKGTTRKLPPFTSKCKPLRFFLFTATSVVAIRLNGPPMPSAWLRALRSPRARKRFARPVRAVSETRWFAARGARGSHDRIASGGQRDGRACFARTARPKSLRLPRRRSALCAVGIRRTPVGARAVRVIGPLAVPSATDGACFDARARNRRGPALRVSRAGSTPVRRTGPRSRSGQLAWRW